MSIRLPFFSHRSAFKFWGCNVDSLAYISILFLLFVARDALGVTGFGLPVVTPIGGKGGEPFVAVGDLNGDGNLDIVSANYGSNNVTVLLGNGLGGFREPAGSPFAVGHGPSAIALGDLNGDGKLDIVTVNTLDSSISVLLGDGAGGFAPAPNSPIAVGKSPVSVALGDVNGDHHIDIVVANAADNTVTVLLSTGSGNFTPAPGSPFPVGRYPTSVVLGDLNGDGKLDIVTANYLGGTLSILAGNGLGAFTALKSVPAPALPYSLALGDFDGDGKLDIVMSIPGGIPPNIPTAGILFGLGDGTFSRWLPLNAELVSYTVAVADINGDGHLDIVFAASNTDTAYLVGSDGDTVSVFLGDGKGHFTPSSGSPFNVGFVNEQGIWTTNPWSVAIGDINNDGHPDIITGGVSDNRITILAGDGTGSFRYADALPVGSLPASLTVGYVNRDGYVDVALADPGSDSVTLLFGDGTGAFKSASGPPVATGRGPSAVVLRDVNSDGVADIIVANFVDNTVSVLLGDGNGSFVAAPASPYRTGSGPVSLVVGDVNGDGRPDIVTANRLSDDVTVLLGDGRGGFHPAPGSPMKLSNVVGQVAVSVALGDVNGDGNVDIVAATNVGLYVLLGDGMGGFASAPGSPFGARIPMSSGLALGDVNGDGYVDVVVADFWYGITVFLGNGSGGFSQGFHSFSPPAPSGVALTDVDGDGKLDIVVADRGMVYFADYFREGRVSVFLGDGMGGFTEMAGSPFDSGGLIAVALAVADVNRDGGLDIIVANRGSSTVATLLNARSQALPISSVTVPIVLSSAGLNGSFFTSEVALANRGTSDAMMTFTYTAAFGGSSGTATGFLLAGQQRIIPDAISFLHDLGIPVGDSGNRGGTLRIDFAGLSSADAGRATVRTTTAVSDGRAGLAYPGLPSSRLLSGPVYICGLRQNVFDRSNVAVVNAGGTSDGSITLRLTVVSGDPAQPQTQVLPDVTLSPGGFSQISGVLASNGLSLTNGYVRVERISGTALFYAYGVINDQANSDGSFVEPVFASPASSMAGLTLPVIVETSAFSSELVLTNFSSSPRTLHCLYVASGLTGGQAAFDISLLPNEQQILPAMVQLLRYRGVIHDPQGGTFAGALFVTDAGGDLRGVSVAARTSTPGGGGRFGLFYSAVPAGSEATTAAWLYGLQQNPDNRTNLALVNVGSADGSADTFRIDLFDGATGQKAGTTNVTVPAKGFLQLNAVLAQYTPSVSNGYALVTRTSGNNPFIAYAVINDGGQPGQRSGDGAFVEADVLPRP